MGLLAAFWAPHALGWRYLGGERHSLSLTVATIKATLIVSAVLVVGGLCRIGRLVRVVSAHSYGVYLLRWLALTVATTLVSDGIIGVPAALVDCLIGTVVRAATSGSRCTS